MSTKKSVTKEEFHPEEIPNEDHLFLRVHKVNCVDGVLNLDRVFAIHGSGMSTNWNKYSNVEHTKHGARIPADNGVISLNVGDIRNIPSTQEVEHSPRNHNRAHTDVKGARDLEILLAFDKVYKWEEKPPINNLDK